MIAVQKGKYPEGVFAIFFMQAFSMVGFSMLFALLTLYCTHVLHFSDQKAYDVSEAFNAQVFAISIFGGYLANRWMGYRLAFLVSAIFSIISFILLLSTNTVAFYYGLGMYVLSQGIMVPSMYVLLGMLYEPGDKRRDGGFILAYIGMNLGSVFASILSGPVSEKYGYHAAFFIGLVFCVLTLINYLLYQYKFKPARLDRVTREHAGEMTLGKKIMGVIFALILIPIVAQFMKYATWNNTILVSLGIVSIILVVVLAFREDRVMRNKMLIFLLLSLISIFFWALYLLAPTVLPLFTERNIDRHVFGILIPAASFSSLNPFFIVTIGPFMSLLWLRFAKAGKAISPATKFAMGLLLMGAGYLVLVPGTFMHNAYGYIFIGWIVLSYFLQTIGELCVGPIGFAMVGELVPRRLEGLMMGVWQLMTGVAGVFTDYLSNLTSRINGVATNPLLTNPGYVHTFLLCGGLVVIAGILTGMAVPWIRKWGHIAEEYQS